MATNTTTVDDKNNNKQFLQSSYVQGCQSSIDGRIGENSMTLDIAELQGKVSVLQSDITTLKTEYEGKFVNQDAALGQINHRVNHLYLNIGALENQKELIISGVPFVSDEDPDALFAMICRQLECSEGEELLTSTSRIYANGLKNGDLNICHGNAQSLCARKNSKLEEVRAALSSHKVDIACFTESWLTASRNNRSIGVQGYSVVRNDRVYKRGGGIAVYYRDTMSCTKIFNTELTPESADKTECLALEFRLNGFKVLLVVFSLVPYGCEPTYYHDTGCSQLDLLVTNDSDKILRFGQVDFPGLSQHDLIYVSLDFDATQPVTVNTYRDYVHFDADALKFATVSIPWRNFYAILDPNHSLEFFTERLKVVHDTCFPLRASSRRNAPNRWFTADVQRAILERDLAYKDWRTAASDVKDLKRRTYKTLRNRANSVIERAKKTFLGGYLDANIPSKLLWTRVKSLGVGKDKSSQPCDHDPDEVNRMFLSSFTPAETRNDQHARILPSQYNFSFRNVHYWEVVNAICEVKSNAVGMDGLPIRFLKIVLPLVIQQITHMFNLFINTSTFPNLWKHAKVLPLKKKSNSNDVTNLRPISILCSLSKAFEKLLDQQMANYIDNNHLLTEHQAGFRKGQSVKTAALRVHDDLASTIDKRGVGVLIESVDLALELLDNYDVRGHKIRVQRAEFQLKGEYNPSLKPKIKKKEKEKMKKMQEALFDWRPEKMRGERSKHERIVIVKNLFEPELFDREVHLLLEYQNDLREECNKCGTCRRVLVFDRHPEGVAQVTMSDPEEADLVVKLLHGRFFGKRKLAAEIWDGRTKYRVAETEADVNKRLDNWEKYLEQKEEAEEAAAAGAASAATTSKPPKAADQEELPAPTEPTTVSDEKELTAEIEPKSAADDSAEQHQPEEEPAAAVEAMDQEEEEGDAN
ncbi:hypothetical protein quinque_004377 [Culex quinquefasciatus]